MEHELGFVCLAKEMKCQQMYAYWRARNIYDTYVYPRTRQGLNTQVLNTQNG